MISHAYRIEVLVDEAIEVITEAQVDLGSEFQNMIVRDLLLNCFPDYRPDEVDEALEILRARGVVKTQETTALGDTVTTRHKVVGAPVLPLLHEDVTLEVLLNLTKEEVS